jgi:hypothetical protein
MAAGAFWLISSALHSRRLWPRSPCPLPRSSALNESKSVRFDYEMVMASMAPARPRLRIGLRLRNHAQSGAETWTPAANAPIQMTA